METLRALTDAKYLYERGQYMDKQTRYDKIMSLGEWGLFSVGQLAQISGYSTSTLHGWGVKAPRVGSGKFNPQSLDTLIQLQIQYSNGKLNTVLLKAAVLDGNSHRVIHKLTGITPSRINRSLQRAEGADTATNL